MLKNTLSSLLVSVAGQYAHVSAPDVGVGLSGGRLVLDNVRLRANAFNSPALPCSILGGTAGRIRVSVPWSALSSSPVSVYLENVHLIAGPKAEVSGDRNKGQDHSPLSDSKRQPSRSQRRKNSTGRLFDCLEGDVHGENAFDDDHESQSDSGRSDSDCDDAFSAHQPSSNGPQRKLLVRDRWHETLLGRLGFNVAVEMYGLKIEYRDVNCISIISLASCNAYSADNKWRPAFMPLDGQGVAVTMRKYIMLNGLHWVMLPRVKDRSCMERRVEELKTQGNEETDLDGDHRNIDVNAHESRHPIIDGISVALKLLLCNSEGVEDGFHIDLAVELEEPVVNFSARQLLWISDILNNGNRSQTRIERERSTKLRVESAVLEKRSRSRATDGSELPRRNRKVDDSPAQSASDGYLQAEVTTRSWESDNESHQTLVVKRGSSFSDSGQPTTLSQTKRVGTGDGSLEPLSASNGDADALSEKSTRSISKDSVCASDDDSDSTPSRQERESLPSANSGSMSGIWQFIVGDNLVEALDEASAALGYDYASEVLPSRLDSDHAEFQFARQAVASAVASGGFTFCVRLVTPDITAREELNSAKEQLAREQVERARLQDSERLIRDAESRVDEVEREKEELQARNRALMRELADLEELTAAASASKDVIIRQLEAALAKAEHMLQAMAQEKVASGRYQKRRHRKHLDTNDRGQEVLSVGDAATLTQLPSRLNSDGSSISRASLDTAVDRVQRSWPRQPEREKSGDLRLASRRHSKFESNTREPELSRGPTAAATKSSEQDSGCVAVRNANRDRALQESVSYDGLTLV